MFFKELWRNERNGEADELQLRLENFYDTINFTKIK